MNISSLYLRLNYYCMSPRPLKLRRVSKPPVIAGMKPYGFTVKEKSTESVFLNLEEYESIRLCDHLMLHQCHAADIMGVSRPTFTRIYAAARIKIAEALVTGKQIIIEGGKVYFDNNWYSCNECGCYFNNPEPEIKPEKCPLCGSSNFTNYDLLPEEIDIEKASIKTVFQQNFCGRRRAGRRRGFENHQK